MALVNQPGRERRGGEVGAADREIAFRRRLQPPDGLGIEVALESRVLALDTVWSVVE